ncbi:MAG: DUF1684 domain-containing protein [Caldilineaceae bacterium]
MDPSWRVEAVLERYDPPRSIPVPTILGTLTPMPSPEALVLYGGWRGASGSMPSSGQWRTVSLIFAGATTSKETYGGGRFLSVDAVDEQGSRSSISSPTIPAPCPVRHLPTPTAAESAQPGNPRRRKVVRSLIAFYSRLSTSISTLRTPFCPAWRSASTHADNG